MAQHSDYNIANQGFPAFRTDLNNVLSAINTLNSGTSRPASAVANSLWLDTTTSTAPTLKYYDGADDISLATIDHVGNTVNWLDSTVSITGLSTTATGTVLTLTDSSINSTQDIRLPTAKSIADDSGNEYLKFVKTASAVNEISITNSATGNSPDLSVTGGDTNIGLSITTKGTGLIKFNDSAYFPEATLTDGATITWDVSTAQVAKVTLGGNRTLSAPTNGATGQFISLLVIQDGTGSRTLTWNSAYEFASDTAPTLTTTASLGDLFTFRYNGTKWLETGRNLKLTLS
jgi:hypothetical protein